MTATIAQALSGWSGSLPTWILVVMAIAVAWRVSRGGGGTAVQELSKANEVLEQAGKTKDARIHELQTKVVALEARTDIAQALQPITDQNVAHEARAQERFERTVAAFQLVMDRFGHDTSDTKGTR